jgi:hypothetical protein
MQLACCYSCLVPSVRTFQPASDKSFRFFSLRRSLSKAQDDITAASTLQGFISSPKILQVLKLPMHDSEVQESTDVDHGGAAPVKQ